MVWFIFFFYKQCSWLLLITASRKKLSQAEIFTNRNGTLCFADCKYNVKGDVQYNVSSDLFLKFLIKIMENNNYNAGYALFSYGGWSDAGQMMVYYNQDSLDGQLDYHPPNDQERLFIYPLKDRILASTIKKLNIGDLPDFKPDIFDGVEYEFISVQKIGDHTVSITSRIFMRMPWVSKNGKYKHIVETFHELKNQFKATKNQFKVTK